ncbi:MAG TPA: phosphoribosylglycinamide formyltransferase [Gammaproteobacteria bacterium]|nr:phosphoribosylglycinamide formyltransferase [Gammaproteobacteria bacterium]
MSPAGIQDTGREAPLPIVVLISGNGSNLQAIIDAIDERGLPARIRAVISNRADAFGLERARRAGIPTEVLDHREFASRQDYDRALMARIDAHEPALVVLAGFMRILTPALVEHYLGRMLNIHPSLLPKYRGLDTHRRALEDGELEHGCTVHFVTPDLDSGPVVLQAAVPVRPDDDAGALARRVQEQEHLIYPLAIRWFAEGRLRLAGTQATLDGHPIDAADYQGNPELAG